MEENSEIITTECHRYRDEINVRLVINYCSTAMGLSSHSNHASFLFDASCYMFDVHYIFRNIHCL
jgi:hypothetical protein